MKSPRLRRAALRKSSLAGFTLLEVLLTSLLASVVLVTLWSLSDIYLKLFVSGRKKIEETQLARSLTQHFAKDISQVNQLVDDASFTALFPTNPSNAKPQSHGMSPRQSFGMTRSGSLDRPPPVGDSALPQPVPGISQSSSSTPENGKSSSDRSSPKFGLFGTKQALRLIVLQTDPRTARGPTDLTEILPQPGQPRPPFASELRAIEYTFASSLESTSGENQRPSGLIRREWPWETWVGLKLANLRTVDDAGSSDMMPDSNSEWTAEDARALESDRGVYHVPQVVGLEFSYFDGEGWESEWNSWERRKLPLLVEVLLRIKTNNHEHQTDNDKEGDEEIESSSPLAEESTSGNSSISTASYGTLYRQLIHLPFAEEMQSSETPEESSPTAPTASFARALPRSGARQP